MSITSYAQNFEDVMLWRALWHVGRGCYVDIGAQDPIIDSVSRAFHEHQWLGLHVEPTPHYADMLRNQRPGDTVIQAAVGNGPAVLRFFEIPNTGISTADASIAAEHRERGFDVHEITVVCITLSAVFEAFAQTEIHWLKIDVEGFEEQVLSSWEASTVRPWIVVIESTLPLTQIETHESWEPILIGYGYSPVYFDGLNRYYISDKHPELKAAFASPPNVFDGFSLNGTASATFHKVIEARYEKKMDQNLAHNEQLQQSLQNDAERLHADLSLLTETHAAQGQALNRKLQVLQDRHEQLQQERVISERALFEQVNQAKREVESLLRTQVQREQALGRRLEVEKQKRDKHEQTQLEKTSLAKQEVESLLRMQAQREREVLAQHFAVLQQAAQEKAELARHHSEQEHALLSQRVDYEKTHNLQLLTQQDEFRHLQVAHSKREQALLDEHRQVQQQQNSLRDALVQREREVLAQLQAAQKQAAQDIAELLHKQSEQEHNLHRQHSEREETLTQQLQALHHTLQSRADQYGLELSNKLDERTRLLEACAALEAQLKAEMQTGKQTNEHLRQLLKEMQHSLEMTHTSLSWRITAPLRKLVSLFILNKNQTLVPISFTEPVKPELHMQVSTKLPPITVNQALLEPLMPTLTKAISPTMPTIASTLGQLLACHDQQFVVCAYQTLLGRAPDSEGLDYYVGRIRTGFSKIQILAQLRLSNESKTYAANLPGLDAAIRQHQQAQYPLIGWVFRRFNGWETNHPVERKLRGIENQLSSLSDESNQRLNKIETAIAGLHNLIVQQAQSIIVELGGAPTNSLDLASAIPVQLKAPSKLKQLSPHARDIYFQLKIAAAIHAGGIA